MIPSLVIQLYPLLHLYFKPRCACRATWISWKRIRCFLDRKIETEILAMESETDEDKWSRVLQALLCLLQEMQRPVLGVLLKSSILDAIRYFPCTTNNPANTNNTKSSFLHFTGGSFLYIQFITQLDLDRSVV